MVDVTARVRAVRREVLTTGTSAYVILHQMQGGRCFHCSRRIVAEPFDRTLRPDGFTRDHLRPRRRGHSLAWNVVLSCDACNATKGHRNPSTRDLRLASMLWTLFAPVAGWAPRPAG